MNPLNNYPIILASSSPRRKQLLEQIDLKFEVIPSNVHEDFSIDLSPPDFVEHYAREKASDVAINHPNHYVIGADTVVVFESEILGKPKDRNDSFRMLKRLSGNTHQVYTGVSIQHLKSAISETFHAITYVTFNTLTDDAIYYYIDTYNPFDKAGSYGIQDWFSVCVNQIDGCFYNVMGFPLSKFYNHFSKLNSSKITNTSN
ncbi:MAG: septum formation protein Maf [Candidatus Marinimicrobia bacterium]|jgi:septum formation protein|nr:septum formation protein Maf [Candidatus Neomarinimicrobiota bacterium]MBT5175222.1 septum formation protein Maf [Candidatus Neomarinimicrobiota bacterium]MBT6128505.1 septum formation protein Maf [Candidatus Neomarinimicrobiota bacterium]MBT6417859.1 septum formation protein Maf [Candidatus Neomarinimicrobiota bacterium]MBT6841970.1 septum formation protein Maf [Candidatus Neomarinimicrobiota bacterium]